MSNTPEVVDLGRSGYAETRERMLRLAERVRKHEVNGKILLVEHDATYTGGRATPSADMTPDVIPVERGGKLTYHGPGQLVVYPVLRVPGRDVRRWLQRLEELGLAVCRAFGLTGTASLDGTGVFVDGQKVVSIGVAIRHWINTHGLAINVDMDLSPFQRIRPCGLNPDVMTDLTRASKRQVTMAEAQDAVRASCSLLAEPNEVTPHAAP